MAGTIIADRIQADTGTGSVQILSNTGTTVATFGGDGQLRFVAGSASVPAIAPAGDLNTGIFFPAADTIAFTEGGVESMRLDSSGNLGLGVTPSAWLSTVKALEFGFGSISSNSAGATYIGGNLFLNSSAQWIYKTTAAASLYQTSSGVHYWFNAASGTAGNVATLTQAMTLDASGNLLVGTTSWDYAGNNGVQFRASGSNNSGLFLETASATIKGFVASDPTASRVGLGSLTNHPLVFIANNAERMRLDSSGNFLVGTTTPSSISASGRGLIEVNGSSDSAFAMKAGGTLYGYLFTSAGEMRIANITANPVTFYTNNTEVGRFDSAGRFMVGTNTSAFNLRISGDAHFGDSYDASKYGIIQITRPASQGTSHHLAFIRSGQQVAGMGFANNSNTFVIANAGTNAGAGMTLAKDGTSWGTQSDERKKNILGYVEDGLNKVATLRSVFFEYKNDESKKRRVGLIAQDVQTVLPEAIHVQDDEDETLNLQYSDLIPLLAKAIQELKAELDATKAKVAALENA